MDLSADPSLSLFQLLDPSVHADPYPFYKRLRETSPVHWDMFMHTWVVTRYDDVLSVLQNFSADRTPNAKQMEALGLPGLSPIAAVMARQMLFLDAPDHTQLRKICSIAFTSRSVSVMEEQIQAVADELIDAVANKRQMDVIADFAEPFPAIVTAHLLGVPPQDHRQLKAWSADFAELLGNFQHNPERTSRVRSALEEMSSYFRAAIREQRDQPKPGLIGSLMRANVDGMHLDEDQIIANIIVTMVGGQETTTNLIGNGLLTLLKNPDTLAEMRDNPGIVKTAVEELLRFESPSQHTARIAPADTLMGGKVIKKGAAVMAIMAAANRDPERFPDADELNLTREDNRHLAFGWAAHFCFGAPLARLEARIAFTTLLGRLSGLVLLDEKLQWRTNSGLRGLRALPVGFDCKVVA